MIKNNFILILLIIPSILFAQHSIKIGENFDEIELGYSTRYDVIKEYKGSILKKTKTRNCPHTDDCGSFYRLNNSITIEKKGIIFLCESETDEIIGQILLYEPFEGVINDSLLIKIGETKAENIFEYLTGFSLTSTNRKKYWIIKKDQISFLVKRVDTDPDYPIKPSLIKDRLIHSVILNKKWPPFDSNRCIKPLFAPKNEEHRNCYIRIHKGGIHYLPIGDDSPYKSVKNGFWKEFYPNHKIKEQGNYIKGVKVGTFEYLDRKGKLSSTKNHFGGYFKLYKWKIIFGVILVLIIILRFKKKKTTANTV